MACSAAIQTEAHKRKRELVGRGRDLDPDDEDYDDGGAVYGDDGPAGGEEGREGDGNEEWQPQAPAAAARRPAKHVRREGGGVAVGGKSYSCRGRLLKREARSGNGGKSALGP